MDGRVALFVKRCDFASNVQIPNAVNERDSLRAIKAGFWRIVQSRNILDPPRSILLLTAYPTLKEL